MPDPRELVFALEFRGRGESLPGSTTQRRARTSAPSQTLSTLVGADGVFARVEPVDGERATLEARVERFGDGTFVEEGEITYGTAGKVTFTTQGRGWVAPAPTPGAVYGAVVWTVTGGAGRFAGARGLITSNFAVSAAGEVVDHHVARLLLP
ncbi:MAG: hypothetical protein DMD78_25285 [Candidatus Rokuibacteriota bacterium]|nr:MAG: hypothetical protein DMD78_25285 [Candidatus Rokubacteria bacterium]